jgi:hypothetical protein
MIKKPKDETVKTDPKCKYYISAQCMNTVDRTHHTKLVHPCEVGAKYCVRDKKV